MIIFKNQIDAKKSHDLYMNANDKYLFQTEHLELLEKGIFPFTCHSVTEEVITYINSNDKLETGLYEHMNFNDLAYTLHYFYGVASQLDSNGNIHFEIPYNEFQLIIQYSDFLFKKYYYGLSRFEREEIAKSENQHRETSYETNY